MCAIDKNKLYILVEIVHRICGGASYRLNIFSNVRFDYVLDKLFKSINLAKRSLLFRRADMRVNGEDLDFVSIFGAIAEANGRPSLP